MEQSSRERVRAARRVVVKVGSGVLSAGGAKLSRAVIGRLAGEIAALRKEGREVLVVSSGAILAGREKLGLKSRPSATQLKQAAAAVGQSRLMHAWEEALAKRGLTAAQILLTREDLRQRRRYLNARNTLLALLRFGTVPVINENDTVADEEIRFGDNDVLSSLTAGLCDADALVLLTDQEGLYTADPRMDPEARLIPFTADGGMEARLGRPGPSGSGGMDSKVRAARAAASEGIPAVLASGLKTGVLSRVLAGERVGTLFAPRPSPLRRRQAWLAFAASPRGRIHVDEGAREALVRGGRSLLASGVKAISEEFEEGDVVSLVCADAEFARGLTNYGAAELARVKGLRTSQIEAVLGYKPADEVVHRDNLAVLHP